MKKIIRACTVAQSVGFFAPMIPEFKEMGLDVVGVCSPGPETTEIEENGGRVVTVSMERRFAPFKDLVSLWKLIRVFRKEKPAMVHSMTPKAGLLCMMAGWFTRVPVRVHTFTGLVFPTAQGLTQKILMMTDAVTCACATHIIPEGEGVKNDLANYHITRKPMNVLGHGNVRGVDMNHFDPENPDIQEKAREIRAKLREGSRSGKVFTFVFIGRLVGDKGITELVDAFTRLNRESPDTRLLLIGRSEPEIDPVNPETIRKIDENPAIWAAGLQSDVRPWLLASDALAFPSYREGFPNVVLEAGAMGLPSIVTDINGSREIIREGENGLIVPTHDTEALLAAMRRFLSYPTEVAAMARSARQLIATRFEQSYVRRCLRDFYRQIL